jgi:hypothetical protein
MNVNKEKLFLVSLILVFIGIAILSLLPPKSIEKIGFWVGPPKLLKPAPGPPDNEVRS